MAFSHEGQIILMQIGTHDNEKSCAISVYEKHRNCNIPGDVRHTIYLSLDMIDDSKRNKSYILYENSSTYGINTPIIKRAFNRFEDWFFESSNKSPLYITTFEDNESKIVPFEFSTFSLIIFNSYYVLLNME